MVIATGPKLAFDEVEGLGPNGHTQSVCHIDHAMTSSAAWQNFVKDPGPIVVGAVQSASCFSPAYAFAMIMETESMLNFDADVGRSFHGKLSLSLAPDHTVSLENAYIQSRHLGDGISYAVGRFFSGIGYMNQQCLDDWDFTDTALPYKAFLGNQYKQDGIQVEWRISPANLSVEWGAELGRGLGSPVVEESDSIGGALYAHVGGTAGVSNAWRAGLSYLGANPKERGYEDTDALGISTRNSFSGKEPYLGH